MRPPITWMKMVQNYLHSHTLARTEANTEFANDPANCVNKKSTP